MERHLRRSGRLRTIEDEGEADGEGDPVGNLAASAVFGQAPPAGPQWVSRLAPLEPQALAYDKPLGSSLDGFTLHAATRAGALCPAGREALLRYVLRPPVAQERVEPRSDGLVRITLKKAYTDGTIAVDMDPLSLLCRLATSVPPLRFQGRMKLLALVKAPTRIARYLATEGEATEVQLRSPGRGPPYWKGGGGRGGQTRWRSGGGDSVETTGRGGLLTPWGRCDVTLPGRGRADVPGCDSWGNEGRGWPPATMRVDRPTALVLPTLRPLPGRDGRGDRAAPPLTGARSPVLEEPRAPPAGAR